MLLSVVASHDGGAPCPSGRRHLGAEHEITHRTLNNLAAVMAEQTVNGEDV